MIWYIATKEIYHNLTTLRFALTMILLPLLMVANALIYGLGKDGYTAQNNTYHSILKQRQTRLQNIAADSLAKLALEGPGNIPKQPSRLKFCVDGADELIPDQVFMQVQGSASRSSGDKDFDYSWSGPWVLEYPLTSSGASSTQRIKMDWVFIGVLMSFFTILFTFDAIAGERTRGTLSLIMSNQVSRGQMLLGKYLGAFVTLTLPLIIGILMNLIAILLTKSIPLDGSDWLRILAIIGLFALHLSNFIFLGLFVSSRVTNAITSLVWLLLTWVCLAFVFPGLLATFVSNLNPIPSVDEVARQKEKQLQQIRDDYNPFGDDGKLPKAASTQDPEATRKWAEFFNKEVAIKTRFADEQIDRQFRQLQFAAGLTQLSPIACFQYAMEGLANTGMVSYMNFVKQARRYRQTFIDFVKTADRNDPESLHIYPVKEGLSQKPVAPDAVPRFEERSSHENVLLPSALLILFNLLFFILAQISFLKSELK